MSGKIGKYQKPEHGWTCFHCGETFTTVGEAREHFGVDPTREPGCIIKVNLGGERGLLNALRKAEDLLARFQAEDSDVQRLALQEQGRHSEALRQAEEAGYARGLKDGMELRDGELAAPRPRVENDGQRKGGGR